MVQPHKIKGQRPGRLPPAHQHQRTNGRAFSPCLLPIDLPGPSAQARQFAGPLARLRREIATSQRTHFEVALFEKKGNAQSVCLAQAEGLGMVKPHKIKGQRPDRLPHAPTLTHRIDLSSVTLKSWLSGQKTSTDPILFGTIVALLRPLDFGSDFFGFTSSAGASWR